MLASKHLQRAKLCSQGESTLLRFGQDLLNVPAAKASRDIRRDCAFSYRQSAIELEVRPQTQKADLSSAQIGAVSPNS